MGGIWFQLCTRGKKYWESEGREHSARKVFVCMHACVCLYMCVLYVCNSHGVTVITILSQQHGERLIQQMDLEFDANTSEALEARK